MKTRFFLIALTIILAISGVFGFISGVAPANAEVNIPEDSVTIWTVNDGGFWKPHSADVGGYYTSTDKIFSPEQIQFKVSEPTGLSFFNGKIVCPEETLVLTEEKHITETLEAGCVATLETWNPEESDWMTFVINFIEVSEAVLSYYLLPDWEDNFGQVREDGQVFQVKLPPGGNHPNSDEWYATLYSGDETGQWYFYDASEGEVWGQNGGNRFYEAISIGDIITVETNHIVHYSVHFLPHDPDLHMVWMCGFHQGSTIDCSGNDFSYQFKVDGINYGPFLKESLYQPVWPLANGESVTITVGLIQNQYGWWAPLENPTIVEIGNENLTVSIPFTLTNVTFLPIVR